MSADRIRRLDDLAQAERQLVTAFAEHAASLPEPVVDVNRIKRRERVRRYVLPAAVVAGLVVLVPVAGRLGVADLVAGNLGTQQVGTSGSRSASEPDSASDSGSPFTGSSQAAPDRSGASAGTNGSADRDGSAGCPIAVHVLRADERAMLATDLMAVVVQAGGERNITLQLPGDTALRAVPPAGTPLPYHICADRRVAAPIDGVRVHYRENLGRALAELAEGIDLLQITAGAPPVATVTVLSSSMQRLTLSIAVTASPIGGQMTVTLGVPDYRLLGFEEGGHNPADGRASRSGSAVRR